MSQGNNRLHVPGQVQIGCQQVQTPQAYPSALPLGGPGGAQVTVFIATEDGQDVTDLSAAITQALMTPKVSHAQR